MNDLVKFEDKYPITMVNGGNILDKFAKLFSMICKSLKNQRIAMMVLLAFISTRMKYPIRVNIVDMNNEFTRNVIPWCKDLVLPDDVLPAKEFLSGLRKGVFTTASGTIFIGQFGSLAKRDKTDLEAFLRSNNVGCVAITGKNDESSALNDGFLKVFVDDDDDIDNIPLSAAIGTLNLNAVKSMIKAISHFQVDVSFISNLIPKHIDRASQKYLKNIAQIITMMEYVSKAKGLIEKAIMSNCDITTYLKLSRPDMQPVCMEDSTLGTFLNYADGLFADGEDAVSENIVATFKAVWQVNYTHLDGMGCMLFLEEKKNIVELIHMKEYERAWANIHDIIEEVNGGNTPSRTEESVRNDLKYLRDNNYLSIRKDTTNAREDLYAVSSAAPKSTLKLRNMQ